MAEEFTCAVDEECRSACKHLPEYQGTGYCVLHYRGEDKADDFQGALHKKLLKMTLTSQAPFPP